ncbi:PEP-CTERM sorting domain-containing protein [Muricoccus aerilatus]|uniref:PEP-CTERM sorting domain-containing protein n=1 Tax=Muricoccus aerilatus TaxID=452982 RepID=UPI0005C1BF27|nr:PEP-CTERM sorting domain-containing protein [Roseomonas aerilata]
MSLQNAALAAGLVLMAAAGPAKADVIYRFQQVGPATGNNFPSVALLNVFGEIVVTDTAAQNGFSLSFFNSFQDDLDRSSIAGLVGLDVNNPGGFNTVTLPSFQLQRPSSVQYTWSFDLTGGAGNGLFRKLGFSTGAEGLFLTFRGTTFTGIFGDETYGCGNLACSLSGTVTTAVPEPASMALFGAGLLGLAAVRRKRAT